MWHSETLLGSFRCAALYSACTQRPIWKWCEDRTFIYGELYIQIFLYEHEPMPEWNITLIHFKLADHFRKKINDDVLEVAGLNCGHIYIETNIPSAVLQWALWWCTGQLESQKILYWIFRILDTFCIFLFDSGLPHWETKFILAPMKNQYVLQDFRIT